MNNMYQVQIRFTLSPAGPVLVSSGSGNRLHPEMPDNTFLMNMDGDVESFVIPGSSLKGVIRHYLSDYYDEKNEVEPLFRYASKLVRDPNTERYKKIHKKSKISVADAYCRTKDTETTTRFSTAIGGVSQGPKGGSLNSMLAVTGGKFPCSIRLKDATKDEILMIFKALDAIISFDICVGGKISRGFGRMNANEFQITIADGYDPKELSPKIIGPFTTIDDARKKLTNPDRQGKEGS